MVDNIANMKVEIIDLKDAIQRLVPNDQVGSELEKLKKEVVNLKAENSEIICKLKVLGLNGYNKILEADRANQKPLYRPKGWKSSSRWLEKRRKSKNWLGSEYKSCIFVPPTPGSELKKLLQQK